MNRDFNRAVVCGGVSGAVIPVRLEDLIPAFNRLDRGESILIARAGERIEGTESPAGEDPHLAFYSSGSTGAPKRVWKSWPEWKRRSRAGAAWTGWTWASAFPPWSFAGIDVALHAWINHGRVRSLPADWNAAWDCLTREKIEALVGTPTYLDLLLAMSPQGRPPEIETLKRVTVGGEVLRPSVGARLRQGFSRARCSVVYASAELGCIARTHRTDGLYEIEQLGLLARDWMIRDGELVVRRGASWRSTGDEVEIDGGLMRVVGRIDGIANVAGTKVNLARVAAVAEQCPGVRQAWAAAVPNAVTGQVVHLRYWSEPDSDDAHVLVRLQKELRAALPKAAWPRRWDRAQPELGPSAKRRDSTAGP